MEKFDIYKDIAKRTNGDIYIGVVGPVRTGKSAFITKLMDLMVTPNILNKTKRQIAIDEMPQSGEGKTITTTEPKFVPGEAVKISIKGKAQAKVRIIDCVGFMVDGAIGDSENGEPRLVKTPWKNEPMPFEEAASFGTEKVITEHSTVGILVTTDGSISSIPRQNYVKAEEKAVNKLKECKKPFIIVLNCKDPTSQNSISLADEISKKYGVKVLCLNVLELDEDKTSAILENLLMEFPLRSFDIKLPKWMQVLPPSCEVISNVISTLKNVCQVTEKMKDYSLIEEALLTVDGIKGLKERMLNLGEGKAEYSLECENGLFYKLISDLCGESVEDEFRLISYVKELNTAKQNYKKLKDALTQVKENGYGIVIPEEADMTLCKPEVVRQGGRYGVKIKADTSCMHLLNINVDAEVSPISGTKKQCNDFASFLTEEYERSPENVWKTNVFGKPLSTLISEEIVNKISCMKEQTKSKMRKTVTRIVNEGRGGVICILL
ncbi:MAG: stage IV sporulation protein A [Clostridia bacterium]|nr:stage IV sporulation protein A [Clostridia bacterium]